MPDLAALSRVSLNQMTVRNLRVPEAIELCRKHGVQWIGLWREPVSRFGLQESARAVREAGLHVSSLCRGGFFPAASKAAREQRIDDNRRAVEEAATLGAGTLVLVCGGTPDRDLAEARRMVSDGIRELLPFAMSHGIRLGIEPLHPMFTASRSVIVTLAESLALIEDLPPENAGVVLDVYHIWWDPALYAQIERARGRIFGFHVCDFMDPPPDFVNGRGMMGDGWADIPRIRQAVDEAGYTGPIEVEIFNQQLWNAPPDEVMERIKACWHEI